MAALAATSDTWGISGPTFLGLYLGLIVIAVAATVLARRRLARSATMTPVTPLDSHPDDVAYLHGGPELAVLTALTAMYLDGRITTSGQRRVRAVGSVGSRASELERAIHRSAHQPVLRTALPGEPSVREALVRVERRLSEAGLLLTAEQRRRIRQAGWMLWVVVAVGVLRAVAGGTAGRSIGFLLVMTVAVAVGAVVVSCTAPRRTDRGDTELTRLRSTHAGLAPQLRPDRQVYGATGAALGVAVFGASALWAADPAFATELGTQRPTPSGSGSDGSGGGGCGGGGCGGGGCGGGGGGCGG
jgi:uncharacterized protein (TIGR04222 family)